MRNKDVGQRRSKIKHNRGSMWMWEVVKNQMKFSPQQMRDYPAMTSLQIFVDIIEEEIIKPKKEWDRIEHDLALWNARYLFK